MSKWNYGILEDAVEKSSSNISITKINNEEGEYPVFGANGFVKNISFYQQEKEYIGIIKDGAGIGRVSKYPAKSSLLSTMQYIIPKSNFDINFILFFLQKVDFEKYKSGSTIPHIYFKDYKSVPFPLTPIEEQKKIANELDKITSLIEKRKLQLEKLDVLVKAKFVEMFGDPVENPMGWENTILDNVFKVTSSKRIYQEQLQDFGVPFYKVSDLVLRIEEKEVLPKSYISQELYNEYKGFDAVPNINDILITSRGTIGKCYIIKENDEFYFQDGMISWLIKKTKDINNIYFIELFKTEYIKMQISNNSAGATVDYLSINNIRNLNIFIPPIELQNQFADYVQKVEQTKETLQKSLSQLETLYKQRMQEYFE